MNQSFRLLRSTYGVLMVTHLFLLYFTSTVDRDRDTKTQTVSKQHKENTDGRKTAGFLLKAMFSYAHTHLWRALFLVHGSRQPPALTVLPGVEVSAR